MNLIDAIKSGKPHRRKHWCNQVNGQVWRAPVDFKTEWGKPYFYETLGDLLADDWEIQEPTVTITRTQLIQALQYTGVHVAEHLPTTRLHLTHGSIVDIARKLGLEGE